MAVSPVLADDPPGVPAAYYGDVEIDGEPAPVGTHVAAVVDGEIVDAIHVEEPGVYGGPDPGDDKLEVRADDGDEVTFQVNGKPVETVPWESASTERVDLSGADIGQPFVEVDINDDESTTTIQPNESATIVTSVTNTGDAAAYDVPIEFVVDGDVRDVTTVSLEEGETAPVTFAIELVEEADYEAVVASPDDSDSTTITVDEDADETPPPTLPPAPPDPGEPNLQVTSVDVSPTQIEVGDSVDVTAVVENFGDAAGSTTLSLTVDGEEVATESVSLEADEETTVEFTKAFDEAGEYNLAVDGVDAGTVTVETETEPPDDDPPDDDPPDDDPRDDEADDDPADDDSISGFGVVAALGALLGALAVAGRRL
ncbi:CARDB domain-containing protein [Halovivax gelatinilyticus]|uniref:CARDB domain-containing protein n=1 Tax=Halovivax gelatinilyticus TaxID=2961597 RepID=UPI0020CA66B4|nr:CARDB domain-containing protein [Halovivax gelatinilyticus]